MAPVYQYKKLDALRNTLRGKLEIAINRTRVFLTPDEVLMGFVEREHIRLMHDVVNLVGALPSSSAFQTRLVGGNGVTLRGIVAFNGRAALPIPNYAEQGLVSDAPEDIRAKVAGWADYRAQIGHAFGDVWDGLSYFNDRCTTARGFALMLPALPGLMASIESSPDTPAGKVSLMQSGTNLGELPRMTREQKGRIADACALVNAVTLMADTPKPQCPTDHAYMVAHQREIPEIREHFMAASEENYTTSSATFL